MFETKGDQPEWRLVYDVIEARSIGDVVTYEELSEALGRDFLANRGPISRAIEEVEDTRKRTYVNERGVGYRMIEAGEHRIASHRHTKRAGKQLKRAQKRIDCADRSLLGPEESRYLDVASAAMGQLYANQIAIAKKLKRHEEVILDVAHETDVNRDRIAALEAAMARAGLMSEEV